MLCTSYGDHRGSRNGFVMTQKRRISKVVFHTHNSNYLSGLTKWFNVTGKPAWSNIVTRDESKSANSQKFTIAWPSSTMLCARPPITHDRNLTFSKAHELHLSRLVDSPLSLTTFPLRCVVTIDAQSTNTSSRAMLSLNINFAIFPENSSLCSTQNFPSPREESNQPSDFPSHALSSSETFVFLLSKLHHNYADNFFIRFTTFVG